MYCVKLQSNNGFQLVHVIVYSGFTSRWRPIDKYKRIVKYNININFNRKHLKYNIMAIFYTLVLTCMIKKESTINLN